MEPLVFEAHGDPAVFNTLTYKRGRIVRDLPWSPALFFSVMGLDGKKRLYYRPEVYAAEHEQRGGGMTAKEFMERDSVKAFFQKSYTTLCELLGEDVEKDQFWRYIYAHTIDGRA